MKDTYYYISGLTTVLSFKRNPILESSRKRGACSGFHSPKLLRAGKETRKFYQKLNGYIMKRITKKSICILIVLISMYYGQLGAAIAGSTIEETISYLETKVPEATGIQMYFTAKILGKEINGTKQERYKLKIVNRELILMQKYSVKHTDTVGDNQELATAPTKITEVIKLENLNPRVSLVYKTNSTEGKDAVKAIYPPHIKIKIRAKPEKKWKAYRNDIEQVASMLNQTRDESPLSYYETDSCLLITTDETAAESIANALSYLILKCRGEEVENK
jgi:hypothetical protein